MVSPNATLIADIDVLSADGCGAVTLAWHPASNPVRLAVRQRQDARPRRSITTLSNRSPLRPSLFPGNGIWTQRTDTGNGLVSLSVVLQKNKAVAELPLIRQIFFVLGEISQVRKCEWGARRTRIQPINASSSMRWVGMNSQDTGKYTVIFGRQGTPFPPCGDALLVCWRGPRMD